MPAPAPAPAPTPASVGVVSLEVSLAAPPERVWEAITAGADAWWAKDFLVTGPTSRFRVEAWPGGRVYEERADGAGSLWFHVTVVEPGRRLDLAGDIGPEWGGPSRSQVSIRLEPAGNGTRLSLTDALVGRLPATLSDALLGGWRLLFGERLKAYVEGR